MWNSVKGQTARRLSNKLPLWNSALHWNTHSYNLVLHAAYSNGTEYACKPIWFAWMIFIYLFYIKDAMRNSQIQYNTHHVTV